LRSYSKKPFLFPQLSEKESILMTNAKTRKRENEQERVKDKGGRGSAGFVNKNK
jgi:hypothetical protein